MQQLQRLVSLHRKFRTLNHGRGNHEPEGDADLHRLQRRKSSFRCSAARGPQPDRERCLSTEKFRSKSWNEFSKPDSPSLDFVFTVCDNAANEVCPWWPGQPMTAHWGVPDPAAVQGTPEEIEHAFSQAFTMLDRRISLFLCLPLSTLDTFSLQKEIDNIGKR
jgi:hypothetical protein